jgi:hypothetical protein
MNRVASASVGFCGKAGGLGATKLRKRRTLKTYTFSLSGASLQFSLQDANTFFPGLNFA